MKGKTMKVTIFGGHLVRSKCSQLGSSLLALMLGFVFAAAVLAQTSVFTYQGKLNDGGIPANGSYDMQFKLFDAVSGGNQVGATQTKTNVPTSIGASTILRRGAGLGWCSSPTCLPLPWTAWRMAVPSLR